MIKTEVILDHEFNGICKNCAKILERGAIVKIRSGSRICPILSDCPFTLERIMLGEKIEEGSVIGVVLDILENNQMRVQLSGIAEVKI